MPYDLSPLLAVIWSGWIATWPTQLLALIWIAWLISWVVASFWSGRTQKHVMTWDSQAYRIPILAGLFCFTPWTAQVLGEQPIWHFGNVGIVRACGSDRDGDLVHVVGANPSRTLLVERDYTQGRSPGH